ncbi:MAG: thioredoxin, partial [Saprospiraceae bacterium]|nr:thioredoxin [Saprospiraceae bacterium]
MDFQKNVLDASKNLPVVVDFWAPWCGPCRILGPVIEQLASEQEGKWKLVKLNTEEYPEIAAQYGIRSIPNVKMFYNGDIIAEFAGALPRHAILKWLEDYLPTEDKKELTILLEELENADDENSIQLLEEFVSAHPNVEEGRGLLAKSIVLKDPTRAAELVSDIKIGHTMADEAEDIRT